MRFEIKGMSKLVKMDDLFETLNNATFKHKKP